MNAASGRQSLLVRNHLLSATVIFIFGLFLGSSSAQGQQAAPRGGRDAVATTDPARPQHSEAKVEAEAENDAYRHSAVVRKLGTLLGMQPEQAATVFEFLNFGLLAVGIGYLLAKNLPKTFRERTSAIQKQLVDARSATEEASVRLNSVEDRLSHLDAQIAGIREQSEKDALAEEQRFRASVEEEKRKIVAAAEQEIASATQEAQRQLQRYAAEHAIDQAARKLVVTAETDRLLVQNFARRLGVEGPKGGEN